MHAAFTETFRDKLVLVVIDNDEKGEKHGSIIYRALFGVAREVKLIRLPDLPPKGDLWDWIEAGGNHAPPRLDDRRPHPCHRFWWKVGTERALAE